VYISGTTRDLAQHRKGVYDACLRQDFLPMLAEDFSAVDRRPLDELLGKVNEADLYLCVLAHRYGFIPEGSDLSVTELEFNRSLQREIPRLVFLMDDEHPVKLSDVDSGEPAERLRAFRERCRREAIVAMYKSADDLSEQVSRALIPFRESRGGPGPGSPFAAERAVYLQQLADVCRWIDLGGLAPQVGGELLRLPLDALFVRLHAERDAPRSEAVPRGASVVGGGTTAVYFDDDGPPRPAARDPREPLFLLHGGLDDDGPPRPAARPGDPRPKGLAGDQPVRTERVDVIDVLKQTRSVVLGDPGSGKTTLLRYFARALALRNLELNNRVGAELFPVYIRLGEYEEYCEKFGPIRLFEFAPIAAKARGMSLPPELLELEASQGRCLFLLDGLDEILVTSHRADIREQVMQLARTSYGVDSPGMPAPFFPCHIVVTSRLVGYRSVVLPRGAFDGFAHFTLSPFDDAEIRRFAEAWYEAIRAKGELSDPRNQNPEALATGIDGNPGVRRLATNPLLMTLIALTYWREVRIPRRRVELYRAATQTLLRNWYRLRTPGLRLDERETTSLLMSIAFHIHLTSSAGLISRHELVEVIQTLKIERGGLTADEARGAVDDFIGTQEEHVGLLQPRGLNGSGETVYGFLHLTFEEYFTARELARLWKQGRFKLDPYLHRPRWDEPTLLAAAHLSDEDDERHANDFVREILGAGSPYEKELHRDLLLAARCLADDVVVSRELSDRVFDGLDRAFSTSIYPLNARTGGVLRDMAGSRLEAAAVRLLVRKLRTGNRHIRREAAKALGRFGEAAARLGAIGALVVLLRDPDRATRFVAARAVGRLGDAGRADALVALVALLRDPDRDTRIAAADALGELGEAAARPDVIAALAPLLNDTEHGHRVATVLGKMCEPAATPEILDMLARLAYSPEGQGKPLEDAAFEALSALVPFYHQAAGVESSRKGMPAARISLAAEWARWLMGEGDESVTPTRLPDGLPALRVLKVRLRNIKAYADTGSVPFVEPGKVLPRSWSLLLGENAAGKSTFLRCVALAASGLGLANEVEPRASAYLRSGATKGLIEILFGLQIAAEPSAAETAEVPFGLEIRAGETAFRQMELSTEPNAEMTFGPVAKAGRLGLLRNQTGLNFGLVCAYGATRGLTVDPKGIIRESDKPAFDSVKPLFDPLARLIDPEVLGKLLAAGDLSNFLNTPARARRRGTQAALRAPRTGLPRPGRVYPRRHQWGRDRRRADPAPRPERRLRQPAGDDGALAPPHTRLDRLEGRLADRRGRRVDRRARPAPAPLVAAARVARPGRRLPQHPVHRYKPLADGRRRRARGVHPRAPRRRRGGRHCLERRAVRPWLARRPDPHQRPLRPAHHPRLRRRGGPGPLRPPAQPARAG
jgi:GTPase SAR1 family protein